MGIFSDFYASVVSTITGGGVLGPPAPTPLQATTDQQQHAIAWLNHARVPQPTASPVKKALITTRQQVMDYGAKGFHVSVDRGRALMQKNQWALAALWASAAQGYHAAWTCGRDLALSGGSNPQSCMDELNNADVLAGIAAKAEKPNVVSTPSGPTATSPINPSPMAEPVPNQIQSMSIFGWMTGTLPGLGLTALGLALLGGKVLGGRRGGGGRRRGGSRRRR